MPLKPEFVRPTLDALRSGEYRQAQGRIGDAKRKHLCCIGVAAVANGWTPGDGDEDTGTAAMFIGIIAHRADHPTELDEWVHWNDGRKLSFPEIADLIEQRYGKGS
jgi:hypothetical protein